jgi:hypothetical protein
MQIIGSKNGSIQRSGEMKLKQRAGEAYEQTMPDITPTRLKEQMDQIANQSVDEKLKELEKLKEQEDNAKEAYQKWLKIPHEKEFQKVNIVTENHAIIKVFYYYEVPKSSVLIIDEKATEAFFKVFPIAKVVASSSPKVKAGDIVNIPAAMAKNELSSHYIDWEQKTTEQPSLKAKYSKPPMYVGKLMEWSHYMYQINPFTDTSIDDQHTFCLPDRYLQTTNNI